MYVCTNQWSSHRLWSEVRLKVVVDRNLPKPVKVGLGMRNKVAKSCYELLI
jgi:hypothetical protein